MYNDESNMCERQERIQTGIKLLSRDQNGNVMFSARPNPFLLNRIHICSNQMNNEFIRNDKYGQFGFKSIIDIYTVNVHKTMGL